MQLRRTLLSIGIGLVLATGAKAEDIVWANGRVLDTHGKPVAGAVVAIYDDSNKVVDYAKTDQNGEYSLAVPKKTLHLHKGGRGFFSEVLRLVGGAAEFASNPVRAGLRAITSDKASGTSNTLTKGGIMASGVAADQILSLASPRSRRPSVVEERKQPGALMMKVVMPGNNDLVSVGRVYWMQQDVFKAGGKQNRILSAWIDPVRLTSTSTEQPSQVDSDYLEFGGCRLEPSIAEVGQRVRIVARMPLPPDPPVYVTVVARNNRTGQMWELTPTGEGVYEGEFQVDKRFPKNDQIISILAYAAQPQSPGRRSEVEGAIDRAGLWDPGKEFRYNPLLVVSRNRADLTLTIVAPEKRR